MQNIYFDEEPKVAIVDNQLFLAVSLLHSQFQWTISKSITQSGKSVSIFLWLLLNHQKDMIFLENKFKSFLYESYICIVEVLLTIHYWALKMVEVISFLKLTGTYLECFEFDQEKSQISDKVIQMWCCHHGKAALTKLSVWSSQCLGYEVLFPCGNISWLEIFCQQRICCSNLITWVNFSVYIHVEGIFSRMGNVLAENYNRLSARVYCCFNSLNVPFSCLDAKDIGHKPQSPASSTKVPT